MAGSAAAQVRPAGTGEPAFTSSAQNTQWFEWPATSGADAYRVQYAYYENNALRVSPTVSYPSAGAGPSWANWSGVASLQHGAQYGICAQGQYSFPNDSLFFPDGPNSCSMGTMLGRRGRSTTFSCTADYGAVADGSLWACVRAADASIPDNPSGPNQTATADRANLSDPA